MQRLILRALLISATAAFTSACGGQLFLSDLTNRAACVTSADCDGGNVCDTQLGICIESSGQCSLTNISGDCGRGRLCDNGVCLCVDATQCTCVDGCASTWCDCAAGQGCNDGACVDIVTDGDNANSCTPQRPDGLCADNGACCEGGGTCCSGGDVCVGDHCVPNERACSLTTPSGWCGAGLGCVRGFCEPLEQCACASDNPNGCCADGETCSGGACIAQQCTGVIAGVCQDDFVCLEAGCTQLPCSLSHPAGACDSGYCSLSGGCVPNGSCGVSGDCNIGSYCSTEALCRPQGTCIVDGDCTNQLGQGYSCISSACVEHTTCTTSADCIATAYCSSAGNCLAAPRCDGDADCASGSEYCAGNGECVANNCCALDADCGGTQICVERGGCDVCIQKGSCEVSTDCAPGSTCDLGTNACNPSGTTCNSNDFTAECAPDVLSCCASGGTCCAYGSLCSDAGRCIPFGSCADDGDCLSGFACERFSCVPTGSAGCDCETNEHCASVRNSDNEVIEICVPNTNCATLGDCPNGSRCNAEYQCELDPQCGDEQLTTGSLVPPNVLVVFDRSGSMNLCGPGDPGLGECGYNYGSCSSATTCDPFDGQAVDNQMECTTFTPGKVCTDAQCDFGCNASPPDCTQPSTVTRWDEAVNAIKGLVASYLNQASFGLSIFPHPPAGATCSKDCNWLSCSDQSNLTAGVVDVAVSLGSNAAINNALDATAPGGSTPTAPTLRAILGLANRGGLNAVDRANAIVLVTDGEPTGDSATVATCEPPCSDGVRNGDETGVDCGGLCPACSNVGGESCADDNACESRDCRTNGSCAPPACTSADDCSSRLCRDGFCRPTACDDDVRNGGETGVDCGGPCASCADGDVCSVASDCVSGVCGSDTCVAPTCTDGLRNGSETGTDCGGACTGACADTASCLSNDDCQSGYCDGVDDLCHPAHCNNGSTDSGETGTDCGGTCKACVTQCTNGVRDGNETSIDCGGGTCPDCGGGKSCSVAGDCLSNTCTVCTDQSCRVNAAIDQLYAIAPRIKTFVVGFQLSGSANLNCNAVHGKSVNHNVAGCDSLTRTTCDDVGAPTCYYNASDAVALQSALDEVIQQIASCRFALDDAPLDPHRVYLYLEDAGDPSSRVPATRNVNYIYDAAVNQIELLGGTCDQVKSGAKIPIVIFGCPSSGG